MKTSMDGIARSLQDARPCISRVLKYLQMDHVASAMKFPNENVSHNCKKRPLNISSFFSFFYEILIIFITYSLSLKTSFEKTVYCGQIYFLL